MTAHILREAAALSKQECRGVYVIRTAADAPWQLVLQLSCPCCLLALVAGRQVVRWMHY